MTQGPLDDDVFANLRLVESKLRAEASLAEFERIAQEIDHLRAALEAVLQGDRRQDADQALEEVRTRIVATIANRLVPLTSKTFDLEPLLALEKILAATLQRLKIHERPDGFECCAPTPPAAPEARHARRLAFATVAQFTKSHFPKSISWTRRDSDCMLVRTKTE